MHLSSFPWRIAFPSSFTFPSHVFQVNIVILFFFQQINYHLQCNSCFLGILLSARLCVRRSNILPLLSANFFSTRAFTVILFRLSIARNGGRCASNELIINYICFRCVNETGNNGLAREARVL